MTTIVTRAGKGAALTFDEMDGNFVNLNTDKTEVLDFEQLRTSLAPVATTGRYSDLVGVPVTVPEAPTDGGVYARVDATWTALATVATTGSYLDLTNTPTLLPDAPQDSHSYLRGNGTWLMAAPVAVSGQYRDLTGTPLLAPVATSGSYPDLSNTPALMPDAPSDGHSYARNNAAWAALAPVATSGNYADLAQTPAIPASSNLITNGNFVINQRQYQSGAAGSLGTSAYRHDGWRDGTYTYTDTPPSTLVTITGTVPLLQKIHPNDVPSTADGVWTLSWKGTALGRLGINGQLPTGPGQPSPITVSGLQGGVSHWVYVDFQPGGTLGEVQLTPGATVPAYVPPYEAVERMRAWKRCFVIYAATPTHYLGTGFVFGSGTDMEFCVNFPRPLQGIPTFSSGGLENLASDRFNVFTSATLDSYLTDVGLLNGAAILLHATNSATSGYMIRLYTQNITFSEPTWFLFEADL